MGCLATHWGPKADASNGRGLLCSNALCLQNRVEYERAENDPAAAETAS